MAVFLAVSENRMCLIDNQQLHMGLELKQGINKHIYFKAIQSNMIMKGSIVQDLYTKLETPTKLDIRE